jgi:hypothetical protein
MITMSKRDRERLYFTGTVIYLYNSQSLTCTPFGIKRMQRSHQRYRYEPHHSRHGQLVANQCDNV